MELSILVRAALEEDLPNGHDVTSEWVVPVALSGEGFIESREDAVVSGTAAVTEVFRQVDPSVDLEFHLRDGDRIRSSERLVSLRGPARSILRAERTALNFLSHLTGVATATRKYVDATREHRTRVLGTRKMTPGLRELETAAIRHGGGDVYRADLSSDVLVKDNHLAAIGGMGELDKLIEQDRSNRRTELDKFLASGKLEVDSLADLDHAVRMGWKRVLLDNFSIEDTVVAVTRYGQMVELESSGGINLENVTQYARTGVHCLSIGALTHSVRSVDFSLEVKWKRN